MATADSITRKLERDRAYAKKRRADGFIRQNGRWSIPDRIPPTEPDEEWRPIPQYEHRYLASSMGRIFTKRGIGKLLKIYRPKDWYPFVTLYSKEGAAKNDTLHAWIARTFLGPTPEGMEINHKDGDKGNPRVSNLEFLTHQQNVDHARAIGLQDNRGARHGMAKLSEEAVISIRSLRKQGMTMKEIGMRFEIGASHVNQILKGRAWSHVQ